MSPFGSCVNPVFMNTKEINKKTKLLALDTIFFQALPNSRYKRKTGVDRMVATQHIRNVCTNAIELNLDNRCCARMCVFATRYK